MKYIFFGTPRFAALVLKELLSAGLPPVALVCNPDRPVGRKKVITAPETKQLALNSQKQIEILQPEKLDEGFLEKLRELNADLYIVAAYAKILKKDLLSIPRLGAIGVHPSLLPKYRGASPIQTAILSGDEMTGVDLFMLTPGIDDGDVIAEEKLPIEDSGYTELQDKLAELGGKLLVKALPEYIAGRIVPKPQNDAEATFTRKFETKDGFIELAKIKEAEITGAEAADIERKVRALNPEPGVYTLSEGNRIKILRTALVEGKLKILQIQKEGGKPSNHSLI